VGEWLFGSRFQLRCGCLETVGVEVLLSGRPTRVHASIHAVVSRDIEQELEQDSVTGANIEAAKQVIARQLFQKRHCDLIGASEQ
jgi:hypothetical protein